MSTKPTQKPENTSQSTDLKDLFADINISMKTGHLVKDSEIVGDGRYVRMRLATNKEYLDSNENVQSKTNYFSIMVSKNLTEAFDLALTFKKGDWVYVKGEDSTRSFDTPEGYKQTASTIFAYKVSLKKRPEPKAVKQPQPAPANG